ncbi:hypothetical protein RRG08_053758 [Elysia crispata]|uniref:Uncharacterized protein n=1 Tax=Elysia crispata TaxID=231223 RepID=A0AAE1CUM3_9GAST|nr:hypothetical protein RRG08_053758 [Elysia crispata]
MSGQVNEWTSKTVVRSKGIGDCESVNETVDSENEWTSKTFARTKGIGDCDSENEWTSKTFVRTKGIGDCDMTLTPPPPPQTIPVETTLVILVEPTPKQPKVITNGIIPPQTLPHLTPPRPTTPPPPVTTTLGGTMSPEKPSRDASWNYLRPKKEDYPPPTMAVEVLPTDAVEVTAQEVITRPTPDQEERKNLS